MSLSFRQKCQDYPHEIRALGSYHLHESSQERPGTYEVTGVATGQVNRHPGCGLTELHSDRVNCWLNSLGTTVLRK